uniref:FYVE-type domain-containing protein n=1 Tax=Haemonchus contortus TaxID=6289 RepID=A0A7I4YIZ8_HAECO
MPIDKENVQTPMTHEVKKRPSMGSPYTSGTPGTRPGPRKQLRPLRELGDQNLETSQVFDETLNMSSVKAELEGSVAQELSSVGIDSIVHRADPNIEESFVESDAPMAQLKESRNVRSCDSNLEDSAIESTMCEMDDTGPTDEAEALTPHKLLHETFVLAEDEADTTLKNEESLAAEAIGSNVENTTEEATQKLDTTRDEESPESDTVICGSVEAVLLYENNDAPSPLNEGSQARELTDSGDGEKSKSGLEVVGSVNVSIVNPEPSQKETLPCVSDLSSAFSFSSYVSCGRGVGGDDVNLSGKDSFNDLNETELVFAVPLAKAGNLPHDKREDTALGCAEYTAITDSSLMDITTGIEETMMVLTEPEKAAALLANNDVFPAHYGSSEVEGRVSRPESTATAIAYESLTQYQSFDTGDQEMVIQGEDTQIVLLEGAKPKDGEISAEDTKSGASDQMTERGLSSKSSAAPRYKSPLSPIADLSRGGATSRASNAPNSFGSQSSTPVLPVNRKYNMNDSEISFLINEVKVLAQEEDRLLNSKSPSEIEQMAMNVAKLEAEKAELHANLRAVSTEMNKYKEKSAAQDAALAEADKKLSELERAKKHAEKTIEDYEFMVANLKKTHVKQKEDLHAKLIAQEEELEKCHAAIRTQADLTYTSAGLSAELAVTSERLLESEAARVAAQKRCEELAEELDKAMNATTTVAVSEEITNANRDLAAVRERLIELENEVLEREQALLTADRRHAEECITLQEKLNEAASALESCEKTIEDLKNQLSTANSEKTILREIQIASEMDLMKTADELKAVKCILEEKEQACKEAVRQRSAAEEELTNLRQQLKEKSEGFEKEMTQLENLKEACTALEEQLEAEKRARDIASREVEQLRDEKCIVEEALDKAEKASKDAEQRIVEVERNLADHIKCHTEEFEHRISELESAIALSSADKEALTSQLEESLKKEAELTTEVMKATEAISKLETDMADAERDKAALEEKVKHGLEMYNEKIAEIEKAVADAAELQTSQKSLELERDRFKEELEAAVEKAQKSEEESQQQNLPLYRDERDSLKSSLAEAEVNKANLEKDLIELGECAFKSQEKIAALIAELAKSEEEWKDKEKEYQARINVAEEVAKKVPQLESTADYLIAETVTLNNTIKEVNSKLAAEAESKREATKALTDLEEQHFSLREEKKVIEKEYEEAKARFDAELTTTHNEARNLKEEMMLLEERLAKEKSAANTKLSRLNAELRESKVAQAEAEAQATEYRQKSEELMEKCALLESKLGEAANEKSEQNSKDIEKELEELQRLVELKEREINRLGDLCDEFDEVEANYKTKVFGLLDENEKLKAQLGLITKPEIPNLRAALTEGVQMLTPETTLVPSDDRVSEEKVKELEKMVDQLTKENTRLEQNSKDIENEMKEWKRLVELKEREINRLGDLCDEFDEVEANYKTKVFGLLDENEKLKAQLGLITKPEIPNLRAALTEGEVFISSEYKWKPRKTALVPSDDRVSEEKVKELKNMVDQLTKENTRLEQLKKTEYANLAKETEELRRQCEIQENRISQLEKICDDADETESKLKQRIAELEEQISPTRIPDEKSRSKIPEPRLLDALGRNNSGLYNLREVNGERSTEQAGVAKEESYVSASSSPQLPQKSLDRTAGPMFEESVVENSATPNRSLHTTLYKKLDKTAKLSDSVESKANTSRCAQQ